MRACNNLGRLDTNVSDAVKTRQEVDLRIGKSRRGGREREREKERERERGRERERESFLTFLTYRLCIYTVPDKASEQGFPKRPHRAAHQLRSLPVPHLRLRGRQGKH